MKKRYKLMLTLVMSLAMFYGMNITASAASISLVDADFSANNSPVYSGSVINQSDFRFGVSENGNSVEEQNYKIKFYSDEACSNPVDNVVNAGVYYATATGEDGYSGTTSAILVKVMKASLVKPEAVTGLVYDGTLQLGVRGIFAEYMELLNGENKEAGSYMATVRLSDPENYCWFGEDADPANADSSMPIDIYYTIMPDKGPEPDPTPTPTPEPEPEKKDEKKEEETPQVNEENLSINPVAVDKTFVTKGDEPIIPGSAYNFSNIRTIKGFSAQIKKAAVKNAAIKNVEVYSSKPMCFDKELIAAINESGKTLVYYFTYEGHLYSVTVPVGTNASVVLNKGPMEGPLYIGKILGTTRLIK